MFRRAAFAYLGLLALAGLAFWPRYLSRLGRGPDSYTHAHALLAVAWCGLLIAQPFLAARNRPLHRKLGRTSLLLAPAFAAASLLLAHARFRAMDAATFRQEAPSLFLPLSAVFLFGTSYGLAIRYRGEVALHARFMVLTGLPMIDPVLGRVLYFYGPPLPHPLDYQAITFGLTDTIVATLLFFPPATGRARLVYARAAVLFPAAHALWFTFAQQPAWLPVASWFRALPLP